jgi:hypothetical protein
MNTKTTAVALAATLALAGCGGSAPQPAATAAAERAVYTNSGDCGDSGKISFETCVSLMERAVVEHEKSAASYKSLRSCETAEGEGRCERSGETNYRPKLLAFLVTFSQPPTAKPLYAAGDAVGFKAADKTKFLVSDETLTFSEHSLTIAEGTVSKKRKSGMFGG